MNKLIYTCVMHHVSATEGIDLIEKLQHKLPAGDHHIIGDFIVTYIAGETTGTGMNIEDIMHEIHETESLEAVFDSFNKPYVILTSDHFHTNVTPENIQVAQCITAKNMLEDIYLMKKHAEDLMKLVKTQATGSAVNEALSFVKPIFAALLAADYNIGVR